MIIWVDDGIFAPGEARDVDRLALLRAAAWRRHTLVVSEEPDGRFASRAAPRYKEWMKSLSEGLRREVEQLRERLRLVSVNAVTRGASRLLVTARAFPVVTGCQVSIDEAPHAVSMPLQLLVENIINDAAFLRCVMPPAWRAQFEKWERRGLLAFENGGGNTVMKPIVEHFACGGDVRSELWRLQHFVVFDHDGDVREKPGEGAGPLEETCKAFGLGGRFHMLERRDQEHYLPPEALTEVTKRAREEVKREVSSYLDLPSVGRHFKKLTKPVKKHLKSAFFKYSDEFDWKDAWFEEDDVWPEMTRLAESIAAAI